MNYEAPKTWGVTTIPVLEFLNGLPWNAITKNLLMALRPSTVRECWGEMKCDAYRWRVTVWLHGTKDYPLIRKIEQEVNVGLLGEFQHAVELEKTLREMGMKSLAI
jgi:hypothetical protein